MCCCLPTAQVAASQILLNDVTDDGAPEAVLFFVALIPDALEFAEVVLDQGKEVGGARIAGPVEVEALRYEQ